MLVINRHENESVLIGDDIVVTVTRVARRGVRIAINAPRSVPVIRLESPGPKGPGRSVIRPGAAARRGPQAGVSSNRGCRSDG